MKIVKTEEVKIHFWDLMNFNKIFGKSATYDDTKSDWKTLSSDSIFFDIYS